MTSAIESVQAELSRKVMKAAADGSAILTWEHLREIDSALAELKESAEKWDALRNCARITAMGAAGVDSSFRVGEDCHITLNFWTHGDRETDVYSRSWLDQFVRKALLLRKKTA